MTQPEFPDGWLAVQLQEVLDFRSGTVDPHRYHDEAFELYSMPAYDAGTGPEVIEGRSIGSSKKQVFPGDVLFARLNPRIPRVWTVQENETGRRKLASTDFVVLVDKHRPDETAWFDSTFLRFQLLSPPFRMQVGGQVQGATGSRQRLSPGKIESATLGIPSLETQRRIVARIEALFAELRECRKLHQAVVEDTNRLMDAVLAEVFGEIGRAAPGVKTIDAMTTVTSGGTPSRSRTDFYGGTIPWVKTGELKDNTIMDTEEHITELAVRESNAKEFPVNTLLIAMYGQGQTRGRTGVLGIKAATNQACCAIIPNPEEFDSFFLQFWFRFIYSSLRQQSESRGGSQPNLNQGMIKKLKPPLPDPSDQRKYVEYLRQVEVEISEIRKTQEGNSQSLAQMEHAILAQAFRGEL